VELEILSEVVLKFLHSDFLTAMHFDSEKQAFVHPVHRFRFFTMQRSYSVDYSL
jgi:hypothetical protein